jgi:hypothetical protein
VFDAVSPQRRRLVLSVAIALLLLIMAVAMISVIRLIAASPDPVSQTDPGPVLWCRATGVTSNRLSRWPKHCARLVGPLSSWTRWAMAPEISGQEPAASRRSRRTQTIRYLPIG